MEKPIKIDQSFIGEGHPVYIIAEIGGNFLTLEEAAKEIDLAIEAGAHAVKLQTFSAETIVTKQSCFTTIAGGANQFELFKKLEISESLHRSVFDYARQKKNHRFFNPELLR